ncbi:Phospholipase A [Micromonospora saelicesensis]|uniref:Phospholipase A n=1 Tax=Micromonospora saelicesensis TaxID=285676 RepID=A0A328NMH3_9ACTN|nr:CBASS cGAMP-activated phospholipase [Micromonospora saelicesensis]RAO29893.1 Phospholipase A [Micromonospora saelicesensis]
MGIVRILAISGGGVRGVIPAVFLEQLERGLGSSINRHFDLISGTSTGGIIALAAAAGIPAREISSLYRQHGKQIFRPRIGGVLRRGGRYSDAPLKSALKEQFKNLRLGDMPVEAVVASSSLESFAGRVFSSTTDPQSSLVDVALASSAAPTYFPAASPIDSQRSYMDGGLWANNPALLAVLHAQHHLSKRVEDIRLLSIGTGTQPLGTTVAEANNIRTLSPRTVRFILEFLMSTQAWFSDTYTELLLSHNHFTRVNPVLPELVRLDDISKALAILPALAEREYEKTGTVLMRLIKTWGAQADSTNAKQDAPPEVVEPAVAENVSGLYPSRAYYHTHRGGRPTIDLYIDLAQVSLTMVSINLATGIAMDGILRKFRELITTRDRPVQICVSLPDPDCRHIFETLAPVLDTSTDELHGRIEMCIQRLRQFRAALPENLRTYFSIRVHRSIPNASAILIDQRTGDGRIQLETKPYGARMQDSFGFEVKSGSTFYTTLVTAYQELLDDGKMIDG